MKYLLVLVTSGWFVVLSLGADARLAWPQFHGPNGSGVAEDQAPPVELGPEMNVKWKVTVPSGPSSPVIAGNKLVLTAFDNGKLYTIAYQRADGKEDWRREAPAKQIEGYHKELGSPASSTPVTDGRKIISYFGSCGLFCYDLDGRELWNYPMPAAVTWGDFGGGVSPVLADNLVILVRDELKGSRILALDAGNGSLKWEKERQSSISYCTPVIWETPAGKHIVAAGQGRMIDYDLRTGQENWFVAGMPGVPCASPLVAGGTLFFAGGSPGGPYDKQKQWPSFNEILKQLDADKDGVVSKAEAEKSDLKDADDSLDANKDGKITREEWDRVRNIIFQTENSAFALSPGGTGDISGSHILWKQTKGLPFVSTSIVYRGQMVMIKDGGLVSAYDAKTGKEVYVQQRAAAAGRYYASPVAANGHIYFTSLDDGTVTVLKAGTATPELVVQNPKLGERVFATPAIADNTLYLRTESNLYAFAEKK